MPELKAAPRGGYVARKWLPADVRDAYGKLYGDGEPQWEAWFNSGPVNLLQARAKHREWSSEIEARIANIRAERKGEGRALTPQGARALAGEWYGWFAAHMAANKWTKDQWRAYRDQCWTGLYGSTDAGPSGDEAFQHVDMNYIRPFVADEAKTAQFLAAKHAQLDRPSRDMFLDYVARDFFAALDLLVRRASGDFGEDQYAKQFPQSGLVNPDLTPWMLFERWIEKAKPAASTVNRWRAVFLRLGQDFRNTGAAALLPEQVQEWANGLISEERSPVTVRDVWVIAARTVFAWAIGEKLIARNPFTGWKLTVPKKRRTRESPAFTPDEISMILKASIAIKPHGKFDAAKRWCPWLAAYSGARMGELTQLRASDVFEQDGIWAIKITPEAGSVKTGSPRSVPLHAHIVEQGFVEFAKASGKGPLFYNEPESKADANDPTNPRRPRAVKTRERLAEWVRQIGVTDPELKPNHAWRHTFKQIGFRAGIPEKTLDAICGHAQASEGRKYGPADLADKAAALRLFPRFKI